MPGADDTCCPAIDNYHYGLDSGLLQKNKQETNILTADLSEQTKTQLNGQESCLSNIILHYEEFWQRKASVINKENSNLQQLQINSNLEDNQFFNELQAHAFEKKKNKNFVLCLESKASLPELVELGLATQLDIDGPTGSGISDKETLSILKENSQSIEKTLQKDFLDLQKIRAEEILERMMLIEEIALVGYWCSLYLYETKIRWESTCILLYKQASRCMEALKIPLQLRKSLEGDKIAQNIRQMENKSYQFSSKSVEQSISIFSQIIQESKYLVSDLMKQSLTVKKYQLCLFKVLQAIILVAEINGHLPHQGSIYPTGFTIQGLKEKLRQYSNLQTKESPSKK